MTRDEALNCQFINQPCLYIGVDTRYQEKLVWIRQLNMPFEKVQMARISLTQSASINQLGVVTGDIQSHWVMLDDLNLLP